MHSHWKSFYLRSWATLTDSQFSLNRFFVPWSLTPNYFTCLCQYVSVHVRLTLRIVLHCVITTTNQHRFLRRRHFAKLLLDNVVPYSTKRFFYRQNNNYFTYKTPNFTLQSYKLHNFHIRLWGQGLPKISHHNSVALWHTVPRLQRGILNNWATLANLSFLKSMYWVSGCKMFFRTKPVQTSKMRTAF